jgi:TPR repeat protein
MIKTPAHAGRTLAENRGHSSTDRDRGIVRLDAPDVMSIDVTGRADGGTGELEKVQRRCPAARANETRLPLVRLATRLAAIQARKKHAAMGMSFLVRVCVLGTGIAVAGTHGALAFDDKVFDDGGGVKAESSPWAVFQFGFSAYKSGHKDQAAEAYRYAAENGQIGATWKLARMYAAGDGVARDDYEAFKFFSEIVEQDVEPGSREESYVSDALVALAGYLKAGIPGSPVEPNPMAAQEYYMRAAANYRNPSAQYEMGKMFLKGEGGVKASVRQAGRWFQLAAEKGHAGAQATLGNLLFQSGKVVRGLAMMTAALERAPPSDQPWIRGMQEEAFSLAGEADRRTAISLAQDILGKGSQNQ